MARPLSQLLKGLLVVLILMPTPALSQFDKAEKVINHTIEMEGGFVNHPKDPGGATKYGITLNTYKKLVNKDATVKDIMVLSLNEAKQFYRTYFFYKYNIEKLPEPVWDIVFDMTVNHGPSNAFSILQLALIKLGQKPAVTGVNDAATQGACQQVSPAALRASIIAQRCSFYAAIIRKKPEMKIFANGWYGSRCAAFVDNQLLG